jgi:hypothetical protein
MKTVFYASPKRYVSSLKMERVFFSETFVSIDPEDGGNMFLGNVGINQS